MSYYTKCCVETCQNVFRPDGDLRFFMLPLGNPPLLAQWLNAIGSDQLCILPPNTIICSEHFVDEDYVLENGSYELSTSAVPSKFNYRNESIVSSNIVGSSVTYNQNNNFGNKRNLSTIINVNKQANKKDVRLGSPYSTSSRNNYKINGCIKTANSPYNTHKIDNDEITFNYRLTNSNDASNDFVEDVFYVERDEGDEDENVSMNANSSNNSLCNTSNSNPVQKVFTNISKAKVRPMWVLNKNTPFKHKLPNSFIRKLKLLGRKNSRLRSKVRDLACRKQDFLDIQIKFWQLKANVMEIEENLLLNGVDTSEYPVFRKIREQEELSGAKDIECDVLLECTLEELKNSKVHTNVSSMTISPESSTAVHPSAENETVIIL